MEEKKTIKPINWTKVLLYAVCIALVSFGIQTYRVGKKQAKIEDQTSIISGLNDTVKVWKDKKGVTHAKTGVITTNDPKDFIKIQNLTGANKKLQDEVANYEKQIKKGGSVTVFTSETKAKAVAPTRVDTIYVPKDGLKVASPVYSSDFNLGGWVVGSTVAKEDSTSVDLKIYNDYTVVVGADKTGFLGLGKPTPFAEIKSLNPYTAIPVSKTYNVNVQTKKNKWVLPLIIGIVAGTAGTAYLIK